MTLLKNQAGIAASLAITAVTAAVLAGCSSGSSATAGASAAPLSGSEIRVLRYLPTNLTVPEIARELPVSPNTVRTHVKNLYAKFGTNRRAGPVERARTLGLLAPRVRGTQ